MTISSRTLRATLSPCLLLGLTTSMASAQQLGAPQAYPQQGAYSQQVPPTPYPQTTTPNGTAATQPNGVQPPAAIPAGPQVPEGFQLNALEDAQLTQVLDAWQASSAKIVTFTCPFERHEYRAAFAPNVKVNDQAPPLNKSTGAISYSKPDKGSFEISEVKTFQMLPPDAKNPQAPARGDWFKQPNTIGERWVCDGRSIYEFRSDLKQVIERQLPPHAAGESLLDGPLPFLFGAESAKLKQRYWMKIDNKNSTNNQIWLGAKPKYQEQAANFSRVDVILDRQSQLPTAMQVTLPNGDRDVYVFNTAQTKINGALDRLQQALFTKPQTPWGWKHVVDSMPMAQTPQPATKPQTK